MTWRAAALLLLALGAPRAAAGQAEDARVDVLVPLPPREHERLHFFDGRTHHVVPGTVTIDRAPYVCDRDGKEFREREAFLLHVRTAHGTPPEALARRLMTREGQLHFVAE